MEKEDIKSKVKEYWGDDPCGSTFAESEKFSKEYFDEIEKHRYKVEPFIHDFADFKNYKNKKVLEVGVGAGTDHMQFARAGAELYGIDLTQAAIDMVNKRLSLEGLKSDVKISDAENLPFEDNSFDYVYSWGVLHHSPNTEKAIDEVYRVCKQDGKVCIMLYHRYSLLVFKLWLVKGLLKLKPFMTFKEVLHDYMESKGTKAYTINEVKMMFDKFDNVRVTPIKTTYDFYGMPLFLKRFFPERLGWFLAITAEKK